MKKKIAIIYCYATIYNNQGLIDKAAYHLMKVNFKEPLLKIQVKSLQLKTLYESGQYDQVFHALDSMAHFLNVKLNYQPII